MRIYVSGLHSGPNPSPGVGTARSLRLAYPRATLVGVDYSNRSTGLHWPDFDQIWLQRPWDELDLDEYRQQIKEVLDSGGLWISGLDLETHWMAGEFSDHPNALLPSVAALRETAKPAAVALGDLPMEPPPFLPCSRPDGDLHAFCRKHGWPVWVKGPYYEARRAGDWPELSLARLQLASTWSTDRLFVQSHIAGYEECVAFCAYKGDLLGCVYKRKREVTPEGKTWAGHVTEVPEFIRDPLLEVVRRLRWTGGAELELVRTPSDELWLIELNTRFPAWIHGATITGHNLPALLVEGATGVPPRKAEASCREFVRVVVEIPARSGFPLAPPAEPAPDSITPSLKHPSGMPLLAKRLPRSRATQASAPALPPSLLNDLEDNDFARLPTPSWVFLSSMARSRFGQAADLARRLSTPSLRVAIAYSMKTNPDERLLVIAHRAGLLAEAISQLEVSKALAHGFTPDQVLLNGPAKWWPSGSTADRVFQAAFCDSLEELRRAVSQVEEGRYPAKVLGVRLRPPALPSRFGIAVESYPVFHELVSLLGRLPGGVPLGVHFHVASSAIGTGRWWELVAAMLRWAQAIETVTGRQLSCLDVGGGWFPDDWNAEYELRLGEAVANVGRTLTGVRQFVLEPGKALVQPVMGLVVRVLEVCDADDTGHEVVVDGSVAELPEVQRYPHRILLRNAATGSWCPVNRGPSRILGRLCMENDIISAGVELPEGLAIGDVLVICDAGAYDRSMSYVFGRG